MSLMVFIGNHTRIPNHTRPIVIDLSSDSDDDDDLQVVDDVPEPDVQNIVTIEIIDDLVVDDIADDCVTEIISDPHVRGFFPDPSIELSDDFNDDTTTSS